MREEQGSVIMLTIFTLGFQIGNGTQELRRSFPWVTKPEWVTQPEWVTKPKGFCNPWELGVGTLPQRVLHASDLFSPRSLSWAPALITNLT